MTIKIIEWVKFFLICICISQNLIFPIGEHMTNLSSLTFNEGLLDGLNAFVAIILMGSAFKWFKCWSIKTGPL